jgi:hypothetical protein
MNAKKQRRLQRVAFTFDDFRKAAIVRGLVAESRELSASAKKQKLVSGYHWWLEDEDDNHLVDYWPSSGTWRIPSTGEKGKCSHWSEVIEIASKLAGSFF